MDYYPGSVSFIQRFGSALNLNVHIHSQVSDGAYARLSDGRLIFLRAPTPTEKEIRKLTIKIACRLHRYLQDRMNAYEGDALAEREPLLAKCYAASIRSLTAMGINAGKPLLRLISPELIKENQKDERTIMGFNLHASKAIEADDREGLERTLRYMGRPPLAKDRLNKAIDGERLILTLKSPWKDGTQKILLIPFELLERLVAIIPPPRKNLVRYHGFFAPNSHLRPEIIANRGELGQHLEHNKICRPGFAKLMTRVFAIDVLECPRGKSKMQRISFVQDQKAIRDILKSLGMATVPPLVAEPDDRVVESDSHQVEYPHEDDDPVTEF